MYAAVSPELTFVVDHVQAILLGLVPVAVVVVGYLLSRQNSKQHAQGRSLVEELTHHVLETKDKVNEVAVDVADVKATVARHDELLQPKTDA